jgi:hypothetical protein
MRSPPGPFRVQPADAPFSEWRDVDILDAVTDLSLMAFADTAQGAAWSRARH